MPAFILWGINSFLIEHKMMSVSSCVYCAVSLCLLCCVLVHSAGLFRVVSLSCWLLQHIYLSVLCVPFWVRVRVRVRSGALQRPASLLSWGSRFQLEWVTDEWRTESGRGLMCWVWRRKVLCVGSLVVRGHKSLLKEKTLDWYSLQVDLVFGVSVNISVDLQLEEKGPWREWTDASIESQTNGMIRSKTKMRFWWWYSCPIFRCVILFVPFLVNSIGMQILLPNSQRPSV